MPALVTLEQVKAGLRIDTDDDDDHLTLLIGAASNRVVSFLKGRADEVLDLDSAGEPSSAGIPDEVTVACIMLVGYFYRNPDQDPDGDFDLGQLPRPVKSLLYMLRDPALA
jgi:uncharacterized phage protein (predicted DNA packaging)